MRRKPEDDVNTNNVVIVRKKGTLTIISYEEARNDELGIIRNIRRVLLQDIDVIVQSICNSTYV